MWVMIWVTACTNKQVMKTLEEKREAKRAAFRRIKEGAVKCGDVERRGPVYCKSKK